MDASAIVAGHILKRELKPKADSYAIDAALSLKTKKTNKAADVVQQPCI